MSLQVWLPLTGHTKNQGLQDFTTTTSSGGTWSNGKVGQCYKTGAAGTIKLNTSITLKTQFTIAFWCRIDSFNTSWARIFNFYTDSNRVCGMCFNNSSSAPRIGFHINQYVNSTSTQVFDQYKWPITIGQWDHIAVTGNGTVINCYHNGQLVYTGSIASGTSINDTYANCFIGGYNASSSRSDCSFNDFRVYDNCLPANEVKKLSQGLVVHYPLSRPGNANLLPASAPGVNQTWSVSGTNWSISNVACSRAPQGRAIRATHTGSSQNQGGMHRSVYDSSTLVNGEVYTLSAWIRASKNMSVLFYNEYMTNTSQTMITTEWKFYTHTSALDTSKTYRSDIVYCASSYASDGCWIETYGMKLEKGNHATPWVPHTADAIYTKMEYNDGVEYDVSGFGNNGTIYNTLTQLSDTPCYDSSTVFDGSGYIKSANQIGGGLTTFTFSCWFKPDSRVLTSGQWYRIGGIGEHKRCQLDITSGNQVRFFVSLDGTTSSSIIGATSTTQIVADTWYHACGTVDGQYVKIYLNGVLEKTTEISSSFSSTLSQNIFVGTVNNGNLFSGNISDFRIYATPLSAADIEELYKMGRTT